MLIPSIDIKGGRVVQLVQGERVAVEDADLDKWIRRFTPFPRVQLIDLDAALGTGTNDSLIAHAAARLPVRVGGGIRTIDRADALIAAGARAVIVGSSLFAGGSVDVRFAADLARAVGRDRVIAAVDSRGGRVVVHGWKTTLSVTPVEAVRALEPYCDEFLYTHVDAEGLMQGTDMTAIARVRDATTRRVTAAGGITTRDEIDSLALMGVDAVVGMAIYTGALDIEPPAGSVERPGASQTFDGSARP